MTVEIQTPWAECHVIKFTAAADGDKDTFLEHEDVLGVVTDDVLSGALDGQLAIIVPRLKVDKAVNGVAPKAGEKAYKEAGGNFTNVATGLCRGHFNENAALSAATAEIYFDGRGQLGSDGS